MNLTFDQTVYWLPRVVGIVFAIFLSLFAINAFQPEYTGAQFVIALILHLLPAAVVLSLLALARRWEGIGGAIFIVVSLLFIFVTGGQYKLSAYAMISGPLMVIGVFFMIGWWRNREPVR